MTKYLSEYDPKSKDLDRLIQSDTSKLKFNNIQLCIAVVIVPAGGGRLIGVHLTRWTTTSPASVTAVQAELTQRAQGACDCYLVATWGYHAETNLLKALRKFCRTIWICNVPEPKPRYGADVDVKVELDGGEVTASVRRHAVLLKNAKGGSIAKPGYNAATAEPGKPSVMTDRDDKPWMGVRFSRL